MAKNLRSSGFGIAQEPQPGKSEPSRCSAACTPPGPQSRGMRHENRETAGGEDESVDESVDLVLIGHVHDPSIHPSGIHPSAQTDRDRQTGQARPRPTPPKCPSPIPIPPPAISIALRTSESLDWRATQVAAGASTSASRTPQSTRRRSLDHSLRRKNTVSQIAEAARCSAPLKRALAFFAFALSALDSQLWFMRHANIGTLNSPNIGRESGEEGVLVDLSRLAT